MLVLRTGGLLIDRRFSLFLPRRSSSSASESVGVAEVACLIELLRPVRPSLDDSCGGDGRSSPRGTGGADSELRDLFETTTPTGDCEIH